MVVLYYFDFLSLSRNQTEKSKWKMHLWTGIETLTLKRTSSLHLFGKQTVAPLILSAVVKTDNFAETYLTNIFKKQLWVPFLLHLCICLFLTALLAFTLNLNIKLKRLQILILYQRLKRISLNKTGCLVIAQKLFECAFKTENSLKTTKNL